MRIVKQEDKFLSIKISNFSNLFIGFVFIMTGSFSLYKLFESQNNSVGGYTISVIFILVGIFLFLTSHATVVDFDKSTGLMFIKKNSIISHNTMTYELSSIVGVEVKHDFAIDYVSDKKEISQNTKIITKVFLLLKDNEPILLDDVSNTRSSGILMGLFIREDATAIANTIGKFLGISVDITNPKEQVSIFNI